MPIDPNASPGSRLIERAWGTAAATALVAGFIAVAALFSHAPGDPPGGLRLGALTTAGVLATAAVRFRPRPTTWILFGMVAGQVGLAFLLNAQGIGTPSVVLTLTAMLGTGWLIAALLMLVAQRQARIRPPAG